VADLIHDTFKRGKYQDVILPLTVLRRLDCVLVPTKEKVLETQAQYRDRLENLAPLLCQDSGFAFHNTSRYDFDKLLADAPHLAANLRNYIAGFSPHMHEVLEKYEINFNPYFYRDTAPLPLEAIEADIHTFKRDIVRMLAEMTVGRPG
jgi:type I restriction enzyme M protein